MKVDRVAMRITGNADRRGRQTLVRGMWREEVGDWYWSWSFTVRKADRRYSLAGFTLPWSDDRWPGDPVDGSIDPDPGDPAVTTGWVDAWARVRRLPVVPIDVQIIGRVDRYEGEPWHPQGHGEDYETGGLDKRRLVRLFEALVLPVDLTRQAQLVLIAPEDIP